MNDHSFCAVSDFCASKNLIKQNGTPEDLDINPCYATSAYGIAQTDKWADVCYQREADIMAWRWETLLPPIATENVVASIPALLLVQASVGCILPLTGRRC